MRLIDADELMRMIPAEEYNARMAITYAPTVDIDSLIAEHEDIGYEKGRRDGYAEAVTDVERHGYWIENDTTYSEVTRQTCTCSVCGRHSPRPLGDFCRWCGAKMDAPTQKSVGNALNALEKGKKMSRYIKDIIYRQDAVELAMQFCPDDDGICSKADEDIRNLLDELEALPSAVVEAEPVRHGHWDETEIYESSDGCTDICQFHCSRCGKWADRMFLYYPSKYDYCPHCGAKMDEEGER